MKRVAALIVLAGILVGGTPFALRLISIPKVQAQNSCTSASFEGAFGYTFTGLTGVKALPLHRSGGWLRTAKGISPGRRQTALMAKSSRETIRVRTT